MEAVLYHTFWRPCWHLAQGRGFLSFAASLRLFAEFFGGRDASQLNCCCTAGFCIRDVNLRKESGGEPSYTVRHTLYLYEKLLSGIKTCIRTVALKGKRSGWLIIEEVVRDEPLKQYWMMGICTVRRKLDELAYFGCATICTGRNAAHTNGNQHFETSRHRKTLLLGYPDLSVIEESRTRTEAMTRTLKRAAACAW